MSFKFFPENDSALSSPAQNFGDGESSAEHCAKSEQIIISEFHYDLTAKLRLASSAISELKNLKDIKLKCVNIPELVDGLVADKNVVDILKSSSDLKPRVYEGGFKTWECTYDLIYYIQDNLLEVLPEQDGANKKPLRVLDLGCGSGLLGLCILELARRRNLDVRVDFQDYNSSVIDHVTIPNTLLNFNDEIASTCRYFSGDWSSFCDLVNDSRYDLILSSETIYNLDYFPKFISVIASTLGKGLETCLYLAAKTFYFGVGGGTKAFLSMIEKDGELEGKTVRIFKEGVKREIIRVKRKSSE